jgi:hypothetical protein
MEGLKKSPLYQVGVPGWITWVLRRPFVEKQLVRWTRMSKRVLRASMCTWRSEMCWWNFPGAEWRRAVMRTPRGSEADGGLHAGVLWEVGVVGGATPGLLGMLPSSVVGVVGTRWVQSDQVRLVVELGSVLSLGGRKRGEPHFRETSPNSSIPFFETAYETRVLICVPTTFFFFAEFLRAHDLCVTENGSCECIQWSTQKEDHGFNLQGSSFYSWHQN